MKVHEPITHGARVRLRDLNNFTKLVFTKYDLLDADASRAAKVLCTADEWGIQSHGVARLRSYCEMLDSGRINPRPQLKLLADAPAVALIDADNGLGLAVGPEANRRAILKAKCAGAAWVFVNNSNHFGIAGYYAAQGLKENLVGISLTNTPPLVSLPGGRGRRLGTNPIAVAFPGATEDPVIADFATSSVSLGSVETAQEEQRSIAADCIADVSGYPSRDPKSLAAGGSLTPLGGTLEGGAHKGYCLAAIVDLLCGPVAGASWGPHVPPFRSGPQVSTSCVGSGIGHLFGFIDIGSFRDASTVRQSVDSWVKEMRATPRVNEASPVLVPGDPEHKARRQSATEGVSLNKTVMRDLQELAASLSLPALDEI